MKKQVFVCFFVFTISVFHLSVPNVVFGQELAGKVFTRYTETFRHPDVHEFFPGVLSSFKKPEIHSVLEPIVIKRMISNPNYIRRFAPDVDDSIVGLLASNEEFRALFRDEQFHAVLEDTNEISELKRLIEEATPRPRVTDCPIPELPKATTLSIVSGNDQSGEIGKSLAQPFVVEVRNQDGELHQGPAVTFTASGGQLSIPTQKKTGDNGQAQINFTLGVNPGIYQIEARVAREDSLNDIQLTQRFTATAIGVALPEPTALEIVPGSNNQIGEAGTTLAQPFVVEVKNKAGQPLSGIGVIFSVRQGGGRLSDETAITGTNGQAEATLTLGALPGENTVEVQVARSLLGTQEFTATAIARPIAQFPLLYWIEADRLYQLDGSGKRNWVQKVDNPVSFTVDMENSKLYWTIRTAKDKGEIYRANLDGAASEKLLNVHSVPRNIAINPSNNGLYWTNESDRIMYAIPSTKGEMKYRPEVIYDELVFPQYIALDVLLNKIYWTEVNKDMTWNIQVANLPVGKNGNQLPKPFKVDLDPLEGIAVVGNKVYWTEKIKDGSRKVSCANVNGSGETTVKILESIPLGLAFDVTGSSLYWTTPHGGIQSVDLIDLNATPAAPSRPAAPSISPVVSVENTLLANYPNPFNPETWIPYQLSASADVSVSIYSVNGHLVRRLDLGHQSAGVYRSSESCGVLGRSQRVR